MTRQNTSPADLQTENAPKGIATCPNCAMRRKADGSDQAGGDFWWCTATPILPAFAGAYVYQDMGEGRGAVGMPINLKLFDPASTYAPLLNSTACPLFEAAA